MDHLSKIKPTEGSATGTLDDVNMTLTMALLYSIDAGAIHKSSDGEESLQTLPLIQDPTWIPILHKKLSNIHPRWNHLGIQSIVQFAWSMALFGLWRQPIALWLQQVCKRNCSWSDSEASFKFEAQCELFNSTASSALKTIFFWKTHIAR